VVFVFASGNLCQANVWHKFKVQRVFTFILIIAAIYGLGILAGKAEKWLERKED
jgi:hypothetical protein